ncbi:hypothetical protein ACPUER_36605 [Burkholderia sp. DN3021]|uniref:hypothetical protein n=1 Tax=Burkholderia sp. DN3021 TaxID=3410137 RepID=UPI003C7AC114
MKSLSVQKVCRLNAGFYGANCSIRKIMPLQRLTSTPPTLPHLQASGASVPVTQRFDKLPSLASAVKGVSNEKDTQKVTIYFGNGGSAPIKTDLMSAIGSYVHRVVNPNKSIDDYPLVFSDKSGLETFNRFREKFPIASSSERPKLTGRLSDDLGAHFGYAIRNVRAVMAEDFEFSPDQKIYVTGHGTAGTDVMQVDDKFFTMKDVSRELASIGVPKNIRDVRLTSCNSADSRKMPAVKDENLSDYSKQFLEKSTLFGLFGSERVRKAPAEYLLDEMSKAGFDEVTVTGYHGAGIYCNGKEFPQSSLRNANAPTNIGYNPEDTVRRSTVSVKFVANEIDRGTSVDP